jgi:hypothetical protein
MIFSENRFPPIGSWPEGMLFRIMLYRPRGALNMRDNSQIGMTITAPSRK